MSKGKILIVDDSGLVRLVVSDELIKLGYETLKATNSDQAIKICKAKKPDLILMDVMLPGRDGFETCKMIKTDPDTKYIPVVFMTAKDKPQDYQSGKRAGGVGYLTKPFETEDLKEIINKHMGKHTLW